MENKEELGRKFAKFVEGSIRGYIVNNPGVFDLATKEGEKVEINLVIQCKNGEREIGGRVRFLKNGH